MMDRLMKPTEYREQGAGRAGRGIFVFFRSLCSVLLVVLVAGCQKPLYQETAFIMGTFVEVKSPDARAHAIVFDEFKKLEALFNLFDPQSELARLNSSQNAVVSEPLFSVINEGRHFAVMTDGAFDVTIGPVSLLWKKRIASRTWPEPRDVAQALDLVGSDDIFIDEATQTVRLLKSDMQLDLGGIAKGFALDRAVRRLREAQIASALINAGGNVYCLGLNRKVPWRVGVLDPFDEDKVMDQVVLTDQAVATAGDYRQYFEWKGKRYSHIIDPKTGYPADSGIVSATVISKDGLTADVLSTACVVLGLKKSRELLGRFADTKGVLVASDGTIYRI
ncbi:MAG: FAD:protein FMN transferase [Candidatus Omnitrophica bacterium]|nr:FAD:protein FMN transferase [Candidatus Omnitrophota bacterium]